MTSVAETQQQTVQQILENRGRIDKELEKVIVGQKAVINELMICLFAGGHCLITGAPGLAKTLLIRTIAQMFDLKFQRIQFTPDLMPADITGTEILEETGDGLRKLQFVKGPIFANVILADEINRTPPKTQAALLEAMQEHQVTAGGTRYPLDEPFFVLATQNPIEMEGTYPLPEAQLDRFMFNVHIDYLPEDDEVQVVIRTTSGKSEPVEQLFSGEDVLRFHEVVRQVPIAEDLVRYAVRLASASRPGQAGSPEFIDQWVSWGAGLRAAQFLVLGGKARALLAGRACDPGRSQGLGLAHAQASHPGRLSSRGRRNPPRGRHSTLVGGGRRALANTLRPHQASAASRRCLSTLGDRVSPPAAPNQSGSKRSTGFVDPAALMRVANLELRAKTVVQGFYNGLHRSPFHGFSVEFSEYREYTPGDDVRYVDWKLLARSDRYYVKRFEDETNLRCHLVLDLSRSMSYGSGDYTKADYAKTLAATLAYFLSTQRDAAGLMTFHQHVDQYLPPRHRPGHFHRLTMMLEQAESGADTDLGAPLDQVAATVNRRGLIVLISDLLAPLESLDKQLACLQARGHEVLVIRVLDPSERTLQLDSPAMYQDLETGREIYVDPEVVREQYVQNFNQHAQQLKDICMQHGIEIYEIATDQSLELVLFDFLNVRARYAGLARRRAPAGGRR